MDTLNVTPFNIFFFHLNVNISLLYFIILFLAQRIELCAYWIPLDCLLYLLFFSTSLNNTFINFFQFYHLFLLLILYEIYSPLCFLYLVFISQMILSFYIHFLSSACFCLPSYNLAILFENFCICVFWSSVIEVIVSIF